MLPPILVKYGSNIVVCTKLLKIFSDQHLGECVFVYCFFLNDFFHSNIFIHSFIRHIFIVYYVLDVGDIRVNESNKIAALLGGRK